MDDKYNELLEVLRTRFESNMDRHKGIIWPNVEEKLIKTPRKLKSLLEMEKTLGEPDVIGFDKKNKEYIFCDCSKESPKGRRSICYDSLGQKLREKEGLYTQGNAIDMAKAIGIEILTEEDYRDLQKLGDFDTKTSSWIKTTDSIRKLGGAIFADKRYNNVFVYHNSAHSFYSSRGFRGIIRV